MRSLEVFGGREAFEQNLERLIEQLKSKRVYNTSVNCPFHTYTRDATDQEIRARRIKGKRRDHIYNYERRKARDLWNVTVKWNDHRVLTYHNDDCRVVMSSNLTPSARYIVIKVFQRQWPDATVMVDETKPEGPPQMRIVIDEVYRITTDEYQWSPTPEEFHRFGFGSGSTGYIQF